MMRNLAAAAILLIGLKFGVEGHGGPALAALVVAFLVAQKTAGPRAVAGHSHGGDRRRVARHEAGHVVAARAVGGRVLSAALHNDGGGLVTWDMSGRPLEAEVQSNITFLRTGELAAGTSRGCSSDRAEARRQLRRLPAKDRGRVKSRGEAEARRIAGRTGEINRIAKRLDREGRL